MSELTAAQLKKYFKRVVRRGPHIKCKNCGVEIDAQPRIGITERRRNHLNGCRKNQLKSGDVKEPVTLKSSDSSKGEMENAIIHNPDENNGGYDDIIIHILLMCVFSKFYFLCCLPLYLCITHLFALNTYRSIGLFMVVFLFRAILDTNPHYAEMAARISLHVFEHYDAWMVVVYSCFRASTQIIQGIQWNQWNHSILA